MARTGAVFLVIHFSCVGQRSQTDGGRESGQKAENTVCSGGEGGEKDIDSTVSLEEKRKAN